MIICNDNNVRDLENVYGVLIFSDYTEPKTKKESECNYLVSCRLVVLVFVANQHLPAHSAANLEP